MSSAHLILRARFSLLPMPVTSSSSVASPHSLFHPRLKTTAESSSPGLTSRITRAYTVTTVFVFSYSITFRVLLVPCAILYWLTVSFWTHINIRHPILSCLTENLADVVYMTLTEVVEGEVDSLSLSGADDVNTAGRR